MEAKLKLFKDMETKMELLEIMINELLGISEGKSTKEDQLQAASAKKKPPEIPKLKNHPKQQHHHNKHCPQHPQCVRVYTLHQII
jgi:hypothetical protein